MSIQSDPADDVGMRRVVADVILSVALLAGTLAFTGWWIRSTMLEPKRTERIAEQVMESPEVRTALGGAISSAVADATGQDKKIIDSAVKGALATDIDLGALAGIVTSAHAAAIGEGPNTVVLSSEALTPLVGAQLAQQASGASFTVPQVDRLSSMRANLTGWLGALALMSGAGIAAAMTLHPRRSRVFRRVGIWLLSMSVWQLLITWVLPATVVPKLTNNPWALLAAKVAETSAMDLRSALVAMCVAGVAALVAGVAWQSVGESMAVRTSTVHPGGQPAVGSAAWNAWAAQNAAIASRREERREQTMAAAARPTRFSGSHERDDRGSADDRWDL